MLQRLTVMAVVLLVGCDDGFQINETAEPILYTAGRVDQVGAGILEISVVMRNPTKKIDANRFSGCIAAGWAQSRGILEVERLRGTLRIEGPVHDNTVRYALYRFEAPKDKAVFSAGLTAGVCRIEGIPTSEEEVEASAGDNNI